MKGKINLPDSSRASVLLLVPFLLMQMSELLQLWCHWHVGWWSVVVWVFGHRELGNTMSPDHLQVPQVYPSEIPAGNCTRGSGSPVGNESSQLWITVFKILWVPGYL